MSGVLVIGGGAAGMMAAITAARLGAETTLFEPNDVLGKKLRITGKGRCNITNDSSVSEVIANIRTGGKFLTSSLTNFPPKETIRFFESIGLPLKTERGGRVFPVSDNANDAADCLTRELSKLGVKITRERVIACAGGVRTASGVTPGGAVIIATGGMSYPKTGSAGDGYAFAEQYGHTVTAPAASLVPLVSPDGFCAEMQGLTLKNVSVKVTHNTEDGKNRPVYKDFGELLFTHFGLSGPIALSASAHMRAFDKGNYIVSIDLKPALSDKELDLRLVSDLAKYSNRDYINSLGDLLPRLMIPVFAGRSGIPPDKKCHSITKSERAAIHALLRSFDINIAAARPIAEAIITSGGVNTKEVNPSTMESKLVPGLFFAGEVLDCDAYTGGYNLQIAWSTGVCAGKAAANTVIGGI